MRACPALAVLVAAAALATSAAAADNLDEVLALLAARRHGHASFVEQHFLAVVKRPLESSGELIYDAPDHLEKHTREPRDESVEVAGDRITMRRGHSQRTLRGSDYPGLLPFIECIRATLAGDRDGLERVFALEFGGTAPRWALRLTPLDPALAKTVTEIRIDGAQDNLLRVEIRQADGDRSLMTLRNFAAP